MTRLELHGAKSVVEIETDDLLAEGVAFVRFAGKLYKATGPRAVFDETDQTIPDGAIVADVVYQQRMRIFHEHHGATANSREIRSGYQALERPGDCPSSTDVVGDFPADGHLGNDGS